MLDYVNTINLNIHWIPLTTSKKMQKKTTLYKWVLIVTEPFNITDNDFHAKKSTRCARVFVVTELFVSETQCTGELSSQYGLEFLNGICTSAHICTSYTHAHCTSSRFIARSALSSAGVNIFSFLNTFLLP